MIDSGNGDDFIRNVNFNATVKADAGDDIVSNKGTYVLINGGEGNDTIVNVGNNVLFQYSGGNDLIEGFNATSTLQIATGKVDTLIRSNGYDLILTAGEDSLTLSGAARYGEVPIFYADGSEVEYTLQKEIVGTRFNDIFKNVAANVTINALAGNDSIGNEVANVTINAGTGNDSIKNSGESVLIEYAAGDGYDVIEDFNATSTLSISDGEYSTQQSGDNVIVTVGDGNITLKGAVGLSTLNIVLAQDDSTYQTFTDNDDAKVTLDADIVIGNATERTATIYLVGNALDNSLLGGSGKDSLYGKDGNDYLVGGAGNDKLFGQNGNDTLWGGIGNDTLKGGDGADVFIYSDGNDVITDYVANDKISIGAEISKSSVKGSDATFTIGSNTLTVKNGKGAEIAFIDADGNERTIIGGAYLANDSSNAKATLASWREVGDATERTKAIKIVGNALDNSIPGGSGKDSLYGNDGNDYLAGNAGNDKLFGHNGDDTLWGGTGNDTLKGGDGADTFIYTAGKDVITDFADNDLLQISGTFSGTYSESANTIAFKVGSTASAITLKNFTATTFNINGDAYQISDDKLVKK